MPEDLKELFPHASKTFLEINPDGIPPSAEPQQVIHDGTDGQAKRKEKDARRYAVRVTAFRKRAVDPDNLCAKYFIDALRYARVIHDDRAQDIDYSITQKQVEKTSQEKTLIEIELL